MDNNTVNISTFANYPDVVDVEQLSEMLGISTKTAYKLLQDGSIQHIKIGRTYKIPKINVLRFIGLCA
ncbi:MAG: helix-turn-helix domain-containing protein [Dethiobacteraceae bacterium]|jgi:excisionase family DNA binding protein